VLDLDSPVIFMNCDRVSLAIGLVMFSAHAASKIVFRKHFVAFF